MSFKPTVVSSSLVVTVTLIASGLSGDARAASTYIALGDSITFGEMDLSYVPSNGDRGYVGLFANFLGNRDGARPTVFNFAIDGETTASFNTAAGRVPPVTGRTDAILAAQNTNYSSNTTTPQRTQFAGTVAAQQAAGNTVDTVTISLGFNDLAATLTSGQPIGAALAEYRAGYSAILTDVRTRLPGADLYLLNYFNPFPADPGNPAGPTFATGGPQLNAIIADLAGEFGAAYVDTNTPFLGNEATYTFIDEQRAGSTIGDPFGGTLPIGNVHPNMMGYAAIATQVIMVPEPTTLAGAALAAMTLSGRRARRRAM